MIERMIKALEKVNSWTCEDLPCYGCPLRLLQKEMGAEDCVDAVDIIIQALREVK